MLYVCGGVIFHAGWEKAQRECRDLKRARGEFVEPEVFPLLGVFFDITLWPVYVLANLRQDGVVFATPCAR